jgi:hypothetical protein
MRRSKRTDEQIAVDIAGLARRHADEVDRSLRTCADEFRALAEGDGVDVSDAQTRRIVTLVLRTLGRDAGVAQRQEIQAWNLLFDPVDIDT